MSLILQRAKTSYVFTHTAGAEHQHVWPLRVTALSTTSGLDSSIFVMQKGDDAGGYQGDVFVAIASVAQMTDLKESFQTGQPFRRTNQVDLACRSPEEADRAWKVIQEDAIDLFRNWSAMTALQAAEVVTITDSGVPASPTVTASTENILTATPSDDGASLEIFINGQSIGFVPVRLTSLPV